MARDRGNGGCLKLAVTLLALYVVWQVAVLSLRVAHEAFAFAGEFAKWILAGLAGAGGLLAVIALVAGLVVGARSLWRRLTAGRRGRKEAYRVDYRHYLRAREWQRGIVATAQRLRRRRWLSREDAHHYCEIADLAVRRLREIDEDLIVMASLPVTQPWTQTVLDGARRILEHLERTHNALARLLAQSAAQAIPAMEQDIQEAADELQALLAALDQLAAEKADPVTGMTEEEALRSLATTTTRAAASPVEQRVPFREPPTTEAHQ